MRVKTDDRRRAIMEAASRVFHKSGFEGASMSAISAALGGSKTTLYSYFESKEDLYEAVMMETVDEQVEAFLAFVVRSSGALRQRLLQFGSAYQDWMLCSDAVAIIRGGIETRDSGALGRRLYERGPLRCWEGVAGFLDQAMAAGCLRRTEPLVAALHLKGLLQAGLLEPYLFGAPTPLGRPQALEAAVDTFLRAYHPEDGPSPGPSQGRAEP